MRASNTHIAGGTAPYQPHHLLAGSWMVSERRARGNTPTRYTLLAPGGAIWSGTGLDPGDSAQVTVTDADGAHKNLHRSRRLGPSVLLDADSLGHGARERDPEPAVSQLDPLELVQCRGSGRGSQMMVELRS